MSKKLTTEEYQRRISEINPNLKIISEYNGEGTRITLMCTRCGTVFERRARVGRDLSYKCDGCEKKKVHTKKSNEEFKKELKTKHPNLTPLTEYRGDGKYITLKCEKCGYIWDVLPTNILRKKGCPRCQGKQKDGKYPKRLILIRDAMIQRCYNEKTKNFKDYGERGIKVYQEWVDKPWTFYEWALANGYKNNLTLDRINNNDGYKPENCRWTTLSAQANNKRNNIKYEYHGEYKTIREWATMLNVDYKKLRNRVYECGFTIEEALEVPYHTKRKNFYKNRSNKTGGA